MSLRSKRMKYTTEGDVELLYAHEGDAGMDLAIKQEVILNPNGAKLVGTGIYIEVPKGHFGMLVPRSSSGKLRIRLANTIGIIDHTYRGEIKLYIENALNETKVLTRGQKVVQLIIVPFATVNPVKVTKLQDTERGDAGFGSTGK